MNILTTAFNTLLYQPLFNALILLYQYIPGQDFGIAVVALTLLLRLVLSPLMAKNIKNQKALSDMQPKIKEIQEKYEDNQEKQAEEIINLYQEKEISPFSAFVPLLIQLPILIALFQVFQQGLDPQSMNWLYGFVPKPGDIDYTFLGLILLSAPSTLLAVFASVLQFFQFKMMDTSQPKTDQKGADVALAIQKQMPYFFSVFTFIFLLKLPAALALYWMATSLFSMGQQYVLNKKYD
ncbi:MAG: membrane protein insertase YidC [Candidatus Nealsonbacteria bacterium]|nr:membrane protein insertase YidC [Candidatus Nealsonbacteria bacterium]